MVGGGANVAGINRQGAKLESDNGAEIKILEVWNSMQLFTQSTNRLYWCNQHSLMTAEMSGSRGVTRKLTGRILSGVKETGTVTS